MDECSAADSASKLATDFDLIWNRLKAAVGVRYDAELGAALGLRQQTVSTTRKRKQIPPVWITRISELYGISADWLLHGRGAARPGERGGPFPEERSWLPRRVRPRLGAGGALEAAEGPETAFAFRHSWLAAYGDPAHMALMDVYGDAMAPEIRDGDTVLLDESQSAVYVGRIYAVALGNEVLVRYLERDAGGLVLLGAAQSARPVRVETGISRAASSRFRVLGRVVWWCRSPR